MFNYSYIVQAKREEREFNLARDSFTTDALIYTSSSMRSPSLLEQERLTERCVHQCSICQKNSGGSPT